MKSLIIPLTVFVLHGATVYADEVDLPHSFVAGTRAIAAEVNENFNTLESAVNDSNERILNQELLTAEQSSDIAALIARIEALENSVGSLVADNNALRTFIDEIAPHMVAEDNRLGFRNIVFDGVNVVVRNGTGSTDELNGLGNLVIGYSGFGAPGVLLDRFCSLPQFNDETSCVDGGGVWDRGQRTGSHNIVVGDFHSYTNYGGIISGKEAIVNGANAVALASSSGTIVSGNTGAAIGAPRGTVAHTAGNGIVIGGGGFNNATGPRAILIGGGSSAAPETDAMVLGTRDATASGEGAIVIGGLSNVASGYLSMAVGGSGNTAAGVASVVVGGSQNSVVPGGFGGSSVFGGQGNQAGAQESAIVGGQGNITAANHATVSGGRGNAALGDGSSVTGGAGNTASGSSSTVSGGATRSASGTHDWVAGTLFEDN